MPWTIWLICSGIGMAAAAALLPVAIRLGHRWNILDHPGQHKRHREPTPPLGGMVLFLSFWLTIGLGVALAPGSFENLRPSLLFVLMGSLIVTLVGLSDDLQPITAWFKLLAQIAAGLVVYIGGLQVEFVTTPFGEVAIGNWSVLLTVLWVVMLTNAINLIDGLDGLAAGVSLIGAITMLVIGLLYDVGGSVVLMLALIGFLGPFLVVNRHPARLFLGDSGSMQIGFYFAVFSLAFPLKSYALSALFVPLVALGVPLVEMVTSFGRRLFAGRSVMRADRRHLFHYLALFGFSARQVVTIFYVLAVVYGLIALAMFYWDRRLVLALLVLFMVVIFGLFFILVAKFAARKRLNGH